LHTFELSSSSLLPLATGGGWDGLGGGVFFFGFCSSGNICVTKYHMISASMIAPPTISRVWILTSTSIGGVTLLTYSTSSGKSTTTYGRCIALFRTTGYTH